MSWSRSSGAGLGGWQRSSAHPRTDPAVDLIRFPSPAHAKVLVKLLKLKFSGQKPDLIVPASHAALRFLLGEGKELFPGTPIVALFNVKRLDDLKHAMVNGNEGRGITGVASTDEPARTLELAL